MNENDEVGNAKVMILGATGMLGSMVTSVLGRAARIKLAATIRDSKLHPFCASTFPTVEWLDLDAATASVDALAVMLEGVDWVVNCIGVIKPYIKDDDPAQVERAIRVNGLFPHALGKAADAIGAKVIQIATDCVYSGLKGDYVEADAHDAFDVYGKTKSLGEANFDSLHHLRCSIIGPEWKCHRSLLDWFLGQPKGASLTGFVNHLWNGVTTYHYAKLCLGVIRNNIGLSRLQHVTAGGKVSKYDMLLSFQTAYDRADLQICGKPSSVAIDRTLATSDPSRNHALWQAAGYTSPPSVAEMIAEMSACRTPFEGEFLCGS